jgi:hypothetical protein
MRKTIFYILMIPASGVLFAPACKRDNIMTYNATDNIYFDYRQNATPTNPGFPSDSMDYSFAYSDASVTETVISIPVSASGAPQNRDRQYSLSIDEGGTAKEGVHFELPPLIIRAGRVHDTLFLKLKRTLDLQEKKVHVTLRLQPGEEFGTALNRRLSFGDTIQMLSFKISVTDELGEGPQWSTYASYFGTFSKKKMLLMHEIVGLPLDFWSVSTLGSPERAYATYYAGAMSRYLKDQAENGNTIYEEDGVTPMKMGTDYQ